MIKEAHKYITIKSLYFGLFGALGAFVSNILFETLGREYVEKLNNIVLEIVIWTSFISLGISLALLLAQNYYLKRSIISKSLVKGGLLGTLTGALSGGIAQIIFGLTADISLIVEITSRIFCWGIFGLGTGWAISIFVPNYPKKNAMIAGFIGGVVGGAVFRFSIEFIPDIYSRLLGVSTIGIFVGLVISIVEEILREAWLKVEFGPKEITNISLGQKPIVLGSSPKADIYLPKDKNYPEETLILYVKDSKVVLINKVSNQTIILKNGSTIGLGNINITVNTRTSVK